MLAVCLLLWTALAQALSRLSKKQDDAPAPGLERLRAELRRLVEAVAPKYAFRRSSAVSLVVYRALTCLCTWDDRSLVRSERAAGLVLVLVIGAVIGIVWATRGLMGVFWGVASIAAIWIVYWTASHFLLEPSRLRSWLHGDGRRDRDR